jgi:flagellar L-ring protein precursor FlgH
MSTARRQPAFVLPACVMLALVGGLAPAAAAQSLFLQPIAQPLDESNQPDTQAHIRSASLLFVQKPKPKQFAIHDQVTIIIDERSTVSADATLDTKKDYDLSAALTKFPSLQAFLEGQIENGDSQSRADLGINSKNKFKGEGTYDRTDKFSARITATVIDVKPNGVMVLEARKTIQKDKETSLLILSGTCRRDDVTDANTVLSTQLADLNLITKNEGQVKDSSTKGFIPRVLEAIFNF